VRCLDVWRYRARQGHQDKTGRHERYRFAIKARCYAATANAWLKLTVWTHAEKTFHAAVARACEKAAISVTEMKEEVQAMQEELIGARKVLSTRGVNAASVEKAESGYRDAEKRLGKSKAVYEAASGEWNVARGECEALLLASNAQLLSTQKSLREAESRALSSEASSEARRGAQSALEDDFRSKCHEMSHLQSEHAIEIEAFKAALDLARGERSEWERAAMRGKLAMEEVEALRASTEERERKVWRMEAEIRALRSGPPLAGSTTCAAEMTQVVDHSQKQQQQQQQHVLEARANARVAKLEAEVETLRRKDPPAATPTTLGGALEGALSPPGGYRFDLKGSGIESQVASIGGHLLTRGVPKEQICGVQEGILRVVREAGEAAGNARVGQLEAQLAQSRGQVKGLEDALGLAQHSRLGKEEARRQAAEEEKPLRATNQSSDASNAGEEVEKPLPASVSGDGRHAVAGLEHRVRDLEAANATLQVELSQARQQQQQQQQQQRSPPPAASGSSGTTAEQAKELLVQQEDEEDEERASLEAELAACQASSCLIIAHMSIYGNNH